MDAPDFAHVRAGAHEELTILRVGQVCDTLRVVMLHLLVVPEQVPVDLNNVKDFLGLSQLLALLQILQRIVALHVVPSSGNVLLQDVHALLALAHRDEQVGVESFTLARNAEDKLLHLLEQLLIRDAPCAPTVHAEVAL